jgi:F-type H+-transporting ATPase subunit b
MALKIKLTPSLIVLLVFSILAISAAAYITLLANGILSLDTLLNVVVLKKLALWIKGDIERFEELAWRIANFSVLIIFLHLALTDRLIDFFSNRKKAIREALDDAAQSKVSAENRYQEVTATFSKAKKEIEDLKSAFIEEGQKERQRLIENGEREAEKIRIQAEKSLEHELTKAKLAIKSETVDLAVNIAEEILKKNLKKKDVSRMTQDYIEKTVKLT